MFGSLFLSSYFKISEKKNEQTKKTLDNIFDDDTDIFSDVASLANKKKPTESSAKNKTETTTATVVKPVAKTNTTKKGNLIRFIV